MPAADDLRCCINSIACPYIGVGAFISKLETAIYRFMQQRHSVWKNFAHFLCNRTIVNDDFINAVFL